MANPEYKEGSLPRHKVPGADLIEQDSAKLVELIGVHKTTPPTLADGDVALTQMDDMGNIKFTLGDPAQAALLSASKLIPYNFDYISVSYTGNNITTVVYKTGGSGGTTVATLTITYSGSKISTITRT